MDLELNHCPWAEYEYKPKTSASIMRNDDAFSIVMKSFETEIRAVNTERNSNVYQDSCMEFFFSPLPEKSSCYFNFEINPLGAMYIGFSPEGTRETSKPLNAPENSYFNMKAAIRENILWEISYRIPFLWIQSHCPEFIVSDRIRIKGNFYKCGDESPRKHYLSWQPLHTPLPDFHVPHCFGDLLF